MMRTYFAPAPLIRLYAPRRSVSDASGCSIAVSRGWVAAEAEPAPTRAKRAQQRATAIRVCLQIRNVSSGEERPRDPAGLLRRGFASLEDPADQVSRFPRTQTRRLHALRTTFRRVSLGPRAGSRGFLACLRRGYVWPYEPELGRRCRPVGDRPRFGGAVLAGEQDSALGARLRLAARSLRPVDRPFSALGGKPREGVQRVRPRLPLPRGLYPRRRRRAKGKRAPLARRPCARPDRSGGHRTREPALPALLRRHDSARTGLSDREQAPQLPGRLLERPRHSRRVRDPVPPLFRGRVTRDRAWTRGRAPPGAHGYALPDVVARRMGRGGDRDRRPHGADLAAMGHRGSPPHRRRGFGWRRRRLTLTGR